MQIASLEVIEYSTSMQTVSVPTPSPKHLPVVGCWVKEESKRYTANTTVYVFFCHKLTLPCPKQIRQQLKESIVSLVHTRRVRGAAEVDRRREVRSSGDWQKDAQTLFSVQNRSSWSVLYFGSCFDETTYIHCVCMSHVNVECWL